MSFMVQYCLCHVQRRGIRFVLYISVRICYQLHMAKGTKLYLAVNARKETNIGSRYE